MANFLSMEWLGRRVVTNKNGREELQMQKGNSKMLIEVVIIAVMLFGWIAMLSTGLRSADENAESSETSRLNPLRYGFQILLVSTVALVFLSRRRTFSERLSLGMIVFGLFSLCQPFTISLYRCGFQTLLAGTLGFIIVSHMKAEVKT
jgi:hypothetical protein